MVDTAGQGGGPIAMPAGVMRAGHGMDDVAWNVLGQTYVPKQLTESCFSWHATLPPGTMVPPHIHPEQDEFIYMLEGVLDLVLDGEEMAAGPGDLVRLPRAIPHGLFSRRQRMVKCFFWVSPARRLYDLFWQLHNLGPTADPAEIVAMSARHEIDFLPPPEE